MDHHITAVTPTKPRLHIAMAVITTTALVLLGCSNSQSTTESASPDMNNTINGTGFSAELDDPSGFIAGLKFLSAEDDADYQCLLNAATESATTRGLQAYPVTTIDRPEIQLFNVGVIATWCKTVGEGNAVDTDILTCRNNGDFNAPGTEALQLIAAPAVETADWDNTVEWIELKSSKIPEQESTDFKVEYSLGNIREEKFFDFTFVPFDGNTYNKELSLSIGSSYRYYDPELVLIVYYQPNETIAVQKSLLASSAMQFRTTATSSYEALKVQVAEALNADSSLDGNANQAALVKATTEIDRRINVINQNSEVLHRQLLEQFAIEQCG